MINSSKTGAATLFILLLILLLALLLRAPRISEGMPFFYHEDEGHHFNRVVRMVQEGELDPKYFHKPSLHFYLRMPVVALSFFVAVKQGHIKSIQEVRTSDPYGLARYAFTASHPGIVKWNRAFSVFLSLGVVLLTFLLAFELSRSRAAGLLSAGLVAISPELIADSAKIGVDVVMVFFSVLGVLLCLKALRTQRRTLLFWGAFACGLAISSKYNAAPIALVPVVVVLLQGNKNISAWLMALFVPLLGFVVGSPAILFSLPLFLDQFAYEIWHYGVAGHEGHMQEPGVAQALFYAHWLCARAVGYAALALAMVGLVVFVKRDARASAVTFIFPFMLFLLMAAQKANFERNMLSLIPFLAVGVAGVFVIRAVRPLFWILTLCILLFQPGYTGLHEALALYTREPESRLMFVDWVNGKVEKRMAAAGELQLPPQVYAQPNIERISVRKQSAEQLYLDGYEYLISDQEVNDSFWKLAYSFDGQSGKQRIVNNPTVLVYQAEPIGKTMARLDPQVLPSIDPESQPHIEQADGEDYIWVHQRFSSVELPEGHTPGAGIEMTIRSPWLGQELLFRSDGKHTPVRLEDRKVNEWQVILVPQVQDSLELGVGRIMIPKELNINSDERSLGIAIAEVRVVGEVSEQ